LSLFGYTPPSKLNTLLVLGRVSNLPTIWSNCLAGWWLAGGGSWHRLLWVCAGVTCLYIGGMFLNDAFDADFDRIHRKQRPIPSGAITEEEVWRLGWTWLALGAGSLIWVNFTTALLAAVLVLVILIYDAIHKVIVLAPVLMAGCRLLVYAIAAAAARHGFGGLAVWSGLALATYVLGLSCLARKESAGAPLRQWLMLLLLAPLLLSYWVDDGSYGEAGCVLSLILLTWVLWALHWTFAQPEPNIRFTVSRLLAGIALVDLLAVAELAQPAILLFAVFFVLALAAQRWVPAT